MSERPAGFIDDWVPCYQGIEINNLRTRTLVFPENTEAEIRGLYNDFIMANYDPYKAPIKEGTFNPQAIFYTGLQGEPKTNHCKSSIIFPVDLGDNPQDADIFVRKFVDWLLEKDIQVAENLPVDFSADARYQIQKFIAETE